MIENNASSKWMCVWPGIVAWAIMNAGSVAASQQIPININCENALDIAVNTTIEGDNTNAPESPGDSRYVYCPLWYSFSVPDAAYYRISGKLGTSSHYFRYALFQGCGGPTPERFGMTTIYLEPGISYALAVGAYDASPENTGPFSFSVAFVPPPENDLCANAAPFSIGDGAVEFSSESATWDGAGAACGTEWDVWYSFTPETTDRYAIETVMYLGFFPFQPATLSLYDTCGGELLEETCFSSIHESPAYLFGANTTINRLLEAGKTYWIAVSGTEDMRCDFLFNVEHVIAGSDCSDAIPVSIPGTVEGTIYNYDPMHLNAHYTYGNIWHAVTPAVSGLYTFTRTPISEEYQPIMRLHTGCDDTDYVSSHIVNGASVIFAPLEANRNYYLEIINGDGDYTVAITLSASTTSPPSNDDCSGAIEMQLNETVQGATENAHSSLEFSYSCSNDVWYSFTPQTSNNYRITATDAANGAGVAIVLFDDCGGTALAYGDTIVLYPLEAGQSYRIAAGATTAEKSDDSALVFQLKVAYALDEETFFSGGNGTEHNPYLIGSPDDLAMLSTWQGAFYENSFLMVADIDMSAIDNFSPIGVMNDTAAATAFSGTFDGAGHEIANLRVSAAINQTGLFGAAKNARISGINLKNCFIENTKQMNPARLFNNQMHNFFRLAGGIAGSLFNSYVSDCIVSGTVVSQFGTAGGIAGYSTSDFHPMLSNCRSSAAIYGRDYAGGIVGNGEDSAIILQVFGSKIYPSIEKCCVTGFVNSMGTAGGIAGNINMSMILDSSVTGHIRAEQYAGGIAGAAYETAIVNTLSAGQVESSTSFS